MDDVTKDLQEYLLTLEDAEAKLDESSWSSSTLASIYHDIQRISEISSEIDMFSLHEAAFSLEVYISSFVDTAKSPSEKQRDEILDLLKELISAGQSIISTPEKDKRPKKAVKEEKKQESFIYGFGPGNGVDEGVTAAILRYGLHARSFTDGEYLITAIKETQPKAIVVDTAMLQDYVPVKDEIDRIKSEENVSIPVMFVSTSDSLGLRVAAVRSGSDAYFAQPFNDVDVATRLLSLLKEEKPKKILIVDDDLTQAEFAQSILSKDGFEVTSITDPKLVLDTLMTFHPDLILMDIYMPEFSGIELTSVIREHSQFADVPIVYLSGEQDSDKQMDALRVGGDDFITKPIRPKHLIEVVRHRIERFQSKKALEPAPLYPEQTPSITSTGLVNNDSYYTEATKYLESGEAKTGVFAHIMPDGMSDIDEFTQHDLLDSIADIATSILNPHEFLTHSENQGFYIYLNRNIQDEGIQALESLRQRFEAEGFHPPGGSPITLSIGVGLPNRDELDIHGILNHAKRACSAAQKNGGNRLEICKLSTSGEDDDARTEETIIAAARSALEHNSLVINFQPILDLVNRVQENYEIHLKLPDVNGDHMSEREYRDPVAKAGIQESIDRWTLEKAMQLLIDRHATGHRTKLFVKQSIQSILNPEMPTWLKSRLAAHQLTGQGLVLEFRLSALSQDLKTVKRAFHAFSDMGVQVNISHFSEKAAAFKVLTYLGADYVSIAPRLLKAEKSVIDDVIQQAHALGTKVIVPNVDDPRSIDLHWSTGADYLQGNFIQRPLTSMDYDFTQVVV